MGRRTIIGRVVRIVLLGASAATIAGCSSLPDMGEFRVPTLNLESFQMHDWNAYARSQTSARPVGPNDLVDGNGYCASVAPPPGTPTSADPSNPSPVAPAAPTRGGVGLDMSECEVVMAAGVPQHVEITTEGGGRTVIMTYTTSDRAGIYRFVDGRLVSLERGPTPPPTQQAQKKPAKKQAKPKQPPKQQPTT